MKQKLKDGWEYDLVSRFRKKGWINANSKVWKSVKRRLNKRFRKEGKQDVANTDYTQ